MQHIFSTLFYVYKTDILIRQTQDIQKEKVQFSIKAKHDSKMTLSAILHSNCCYRYDPYIAEYLLTVQSFSQ